MNNSTREIKFRAWSPYWETMFYTDGRFSSVSGCQFEETDFIFKVDFTGLSLGIIEVVDELVSGEHHQDYKLIERKDTVFQQYTGLVDMTGAPIYEGDLLEWDAEVWGCDFIEEVKWDYGLLDARQYDWPKHCSIVGHIYDGDSHE